MDDYIRAFSLLFALLNPFLMSIYLLELIRKLSLGVFTRVLLRGGFISLVVFSLFAWSGERFFTDFLQVSFAAFQIFGGIIFLVIGMRFVFSGAEAVHTLRGPPEHLAGAVAMPFMIGPGTVSASVLIGNRLPLLDAWLVVAATMIIVVVLVICLKFIHDVVQRRNEKLVERYIDIMGRISALVIGTIAVEMILRGVGEWLKDIFPG
jgi:small neutral amino acid transporter SnatA (MarC family)